MFAVWLYLTVLTHALMMEAVGGEINIKGLVPFKVEKAEGIPKTNFRFNCGLFVVKMLECHSLKIEDISLTCEIFNQFVDENIEK
ncbi:hypothetical protein N665_0178s0011 [Sinapis alba]|nr:hypothetical protein N665_0178s0011 [Sinapis alba]